MRLDPVQVLLSGVDERLAAAEALLRAHVTNNGNVEREAAVNKIITLATVGTGGCGGNFGRQRMATQRCGNISRS